MGCHFLDSVMGCCGIHLPLFARLNLVLEPSRFHQPDWHGFLLLIDSSSGAICGLHQPPKADPLLAQSVAHLVPVQVLRVDRWQGKSRPELHQEARSDVWFPAVPALIFSDLRVIVVAQSSCPPRNTLQIPFVPNANFDEYQSAK